MVMLSKPKHPLNAPAFMFVTSSGTTKLVTVLFFTPVIVQIVSVEAKLNGSYSVLTFAVATILTSLSTVKVGIDLSLVDKTPSTYIPPPS